MVLSIRFEGLLTNTPAWCVLAAAVARAGWGRWLGNGAARVSGQAEGVFRVEVHLHHRVGTTGPDVLVLG
jgi:hypothetical protein